MKTRNEILKTLENMKTPRSAWGRGVLDYAVDMVDALEVETFEDAADLKKALLNGADDWSAYSWGGGAYVYDGDICGALCTPSEIKKTRNGERRPNAREERLDVQARALSQACRLVISAARN